MPDNVVLQNLRDFTVQIRHADTDKIVGTGVVVSMDGKVVTCAHVAHAALSKHPREAIGAEVGVYFPQLRGGEKKARCATVTKCFPQHDDDVVLLTLTDGSTPLGPEQIAVLGGCGSIGRARLPQLWLQPDRHVSFHVCIWHDHGHGRAAAGQAIAS